MLGYLEERNKEHLIARTEISEETRGLGAGSVGQKDIGFEADLRLKETVR